MREHNKDSDTKNKTIKQTIKIMLQTLFVVLCALQ